MKSETINYTKQEEKLFQQLEALGKHCSFYDFKKVDPLSLEIILEKCALAWKINKSTLIGKINHNKPEERMMKLSFLFGCRLFSDKDEDDLNALVGYGKILFYKSVRHILPVLQSRTRFSTTILLFIQSLVVLSSHRFNLMVQYSENERKRSDPVKSSTDESFSILKNSAEVLEQKFQDLLNQFNEDLAYMKADIKLAKDGGIPKNVHWPLWQKGGKTKAITIKDRLVFANEYSFWEIKDSDDNYRRWLVRGFAAEIDLFKHRHRN